MQFEVPQFIEVEDKIVGPLTWRQFIYLAGGGGVLIILYFSGLPKFLFLLIGLPFGALAGFLAFHKVNNRPFSIFLESAVNFFRKNKLYLWKKEESQTIMEYPTPTYEKAGAPSVERGREKLNSLAQKLEFYSSLDVDDHARKE